MKSDGVEVEHEFVGDGDDSRDRVDRASAHGRYDQASGVPVVERTRLNVIGRDDRDDVLFHAFDVVREAVAVEVDYLHESDLHRVDLTLGRVVDARVA